MNKLAEIKLSPDGGFKGFGPLGLEGGQDGVSVFVNFLSSAIGLITIIAIIWFIFIFLIGAVGIISSGGDKNSLESAKKKISSGVIGIAVTILAIFIIKLIGVLLGITDILDFTTMFNSLLIN
ncbi:hypothetical protein A2422_04005 [Candidatus Woesebacteria bacterium RIFOXYC1_FULL_31_51]|uniref:Integral membrane protein n=1 Tax=Candidatus Woesebacteria bacterium GW2011_GWC2_31_9 TaxID=1618586 RepID=A0A0G0BLT1_9BACT|nr:MAG: hypothetical protein UR17_C0001G0302 [Candidatus Woesebacteria bacterium GW2011_GWF1_31_35]KKP23204.1 MAG: hypothetical protein UR11_C0001G0178 [Candidatus Woesebacteria bacterium GW2011_GWC1_30_29]KKP26892.1 MAG: hypothetical protein UR13_C0002G0127 [Candidatus Woesebacteria bacterium GW2011_GWD1_31_12]KKP27466.1 MAG: hypothetical protein UR16_C0003G0126 [Candidatus Woesebacteria bacterium GW2011_GWB1_31_29]KKP31124.1 MAG: hypothetical protein UR20_C0043G0007 [Candidatus Woesebacteria 